MSGHQRLFIAGVVDSVEQLEHKVANISGPRILVKFWNGPIGILRDPRGNLIHEKKLKTKILCQTPFNQIFISVALKGTYWCKCTLYSTLKAHLPLFLKTGNVISLNKIPSASFRRRVSSFRSEPAASAADPAAPGGPQRSQHTLSHLPGLSHSVLAHQISFVNKMPLKQVFFAFAPYSVCISSVW